MQTVSVIIPYHKDYTPSDKLQRAKESIVNQSVETESIIVIDEYSNGPAWARNKGLERASHQYVAFLDADDFWEPDKLERQLMRLEATGLGLCVEGNPPMGTQEFMRGLYCGELSSITSSILIDRGQVDTRWEESLERKEDHLFMLETAYEAGVCVCSDIVNIEKHEKGLTATGDRETVLRAERRYIDLAVELVPPLQPYYDGQAADIWFRTGRHYHFIGEYRQALRAFTISSQYAFSPYLIPAVVMTIIHWLSPVHPMDMDGDLLSSIAKSK